MAPSVHLPDLANTVGYMADNITNFTVSRSFYFPSSRPFARQAKFQSKTFPIYETVLSKNKAMARLLLPSLYNFLINAVVQKVRDLERPPPPPPFLPLPPQNQRRIQNCNTFVY